MYYFSTWNFVEIMMTIDTKAFNYTNKNLDEFFKLRKEKNKMIKLNVIVPNSTPNYFDQCPIYSSVWNIRNNYDGPSNHDDYDYIGRSKIAKLVFQKVGDPPHSYFTDSEVQN